MTDLNLLLRCALPTDHNYYNLTASVHNSKIFNNLTDLDYQNTHRVDSLSSLVTVSGMLLVLFVDVILSNEFIKHASPETDKQRKIFSGKTFSRILALTILVLVLPLVTTFLILASFYKILCSVLIKWSDERFVEFLDSFDVFWCLEDEATKSIINVLGVIESDSPITLQNNIKEKLRSILFCKDIQKIFYRRQEKYGFYYWRKYDFINIEKYVEIVESQNDFIDASGLENMMVDMQEKSLPYEDKGLFQILITRQRVGKKLNVRGEYGIIFRIHHSVGDGVALIEFLCQTLADPAEGTHIKLFSMPKSYNNTSPTNLLDTIERLCKIPICFIDGALRKPDQNQLHGKPLIGKKIFKWTNADENLIAKIKEIKDVNNINFTDVLTKALSSGLQMFFKEKDVPVPEEIAAILPVRFSNHLSANSKPKFKNDFTVTTLDVPVRNSNMDEIKFRCNELRKSADPLTNYYFLKLVTSTLPRSILYPVLQSVQATLVFSNMPGPDHLSICGGDLKSLVFFVPNKGTTGLGITALCYGGVLRFAAMADAAVISNPDNLAIILNGMVEEVNRLHQQYVK